MPPPAGTTIRIRSGFTGWMLAVLLLVLGALAAVALWESRHLASRLEDLRRTSARQAETHLRGLVELETSQIAAFTTSYGYWDELVTAIAHADQAWITTNVGPALRDFRLDAILVLDAQGHLVHACGTAPPAATGILDGVDPSARRTGHAIAALPSGLADIAWGTVHPSQDAGRTTPVRGILIAIRHWSPERCREIARLFSGSVRLCQGGGPADGVAAQVSLPLLDVHGAAIGRLDADRPEPLIATIAEQHRQRLWILIAVGIMPVLGLLTAWAFLVGRPLRRLAQAVADDDTATAETISRRGDELGAVAAAIRDELAGRHRLAAEVARRQAMEGQIHAAEEQVRAANERLNDDLQRVHRAEEAQRESEMRISLALQGGNLSMWEMLLPQQQWIVDHEWLAFLGVTLDPTAGDSSSWEARVHPKELPALRTAIAEIAGDAVGALECTFRIVKDDGSPLWIMARGCVAERDAEGRPVRLAGTLLDITRWRTLEEQLLQSQKMESIGQLAAGLAHEINTPIQFIGDNTRFAADAFAATQRVVDAGRAELRHLPPDHPAHRRMAEAEEQADLAYLAAEVPKALAQTIEGIDRVAAIVRAMKEFSQPGSNDRIPTDLNHLVESTLTISGNAWRQAATVETDLARDLPLVPLAAGDMNQVLLNLIVNAAQAIEDAHAKQGKALPGRIRITTAIGEGGALLTVADDGCGIPAEIQPRIFDPFFTTKEVGRGTGQGLAIARAIVVDRHGGTITCTSVVGEGSTFTITLPLAPAKG